MIEYGIVATIVGYGVNNRMKKSPKQLLFSLTSSDFEWSYTKGTGSGGQKKNKTSSAVHCIHRPSGAHGYAEDSRSQHENKRTGVRSFDRNKRISNVVKNGNNEEKRIVGRN